ncbi:hypothetical protein [Streptomyces sp. NPDC002232]|uniref:hypothetical protein n=1 Tax=Streptomyces sp. NPDC002232 TaxID=3364640 RepID=UPI00368A819C
MAMTPFISPDDFDQFLIIVADAMNDVVTAEPRLVPRFARSRTVMAQAEQELSEGNQVGPAFKIANTALLAASEHFMRTDPERARELLDIAVRLYSYRNADRFAVSLEKCTELLLQLDALPPGVGGPVPPLSPHATLRPPAPAPAPTPIAAPAPAPAPMAEAPAPAPQAPPVAVQPTVTPAPAQPIVAPAPVPRPRPYGGADGGPGVGSSWRRTATADYDGEEGESESLRALRDHPRNVSWDQLLLEWRGGADGTPAHELLDAFGEHVAGVIRRHAPTASEQFIAILEDDLVHLREQLVGVSVPADVYEPLHERAKEVRHVAANDLRAYTRGGTASEAQRIRLEWLATALLNLSLRVHLPENGHQIAADVLGYLQTLQVEHRYNNDRRELLLAAAEATTLVAVGELRDYHLGRVDFVCRWVRHAVGIRLLVGGPEPVEPGETRAHRRVQRQDSPGRYHHPDTWAASLLRQWSDEPERWNSVAFILLLLSNWKAEGLDRLLAALYFRSYETAAGPGTEDEDKTRGFWRERCLEMLGAARAIRVVRNAWEPGAAGARASTSMSLAERDSTVQLPNRLLQGVAVELAPRTNGAVMQGALFADRPVPTFLASNVFGPIGVLKIDEAAKVQREKENFDRYGEALHPVYRSSKCSVSTVTVINSSNGLRYQGILTSYVFRNRDEPTTFRTWLVRTGDAKDEKLQDVVDELLLEALGPWLSNASRAMGDLRGEYPALRPDDYDRTSYAPGKDARTELEHFRAPEVAEIFGVEGGLTWRPRTLGELFKGSSLPGTEVFTDDDAKLTNPLWLVAHIAEVFPGDDGDEGDRGCAAGGGAVAGTDAAGEAAAGEAAAGEAVAGEDPSELLEWLLYDRQGGLTTRSYLTCVSHGDLHCENVLVGGAERPVPDLYLIDFETTHRGHICKDFARLESALWSRTFAWTPEQLAEIRAWFAQGQCGDALWAPEIPEQADPKVRRVLTCVKRLRAILKGCEQPNWACTDVEYRWALFASLLPFARYRDHEAPNNRLLPFLLAAEVAQGLVDDAAKATGTAPRGA